MSLDVHNLEDIATDCEKEPWFTIWFWSDTLTMIVGMAANVALLWLLLRDIKAISASKVLGLNLALMDILYLSVTPLSLVVRDENYPQKDGNRSLQLDSNRSNPDIVQDIFDMLNMVGCPLLLACMCIERYLAVAKPVLFRRVAKLEYRVALSAVVWLITFAFCVAVGISNSFDIVLLPISGLISSLFIVMLTCLGGLLWSLRRKSPAHTISRSPAHMTPQKAKAVKNVLLVVVPSVISYFPVLVLFPVIFYMSTGEVLLNAGLCNVVPLCSLFPKLGVLIGPLFYFSKVRQVLRIWRTGDMGNAKT